MDEGSRQGGCVNTQRFDPNRLECPECKADWRASKIPEASRHLYGNSEWFSRLIGVELPYDHPDHYDGVSFWRCPDCGSQWNRFTGQSYQEKPKP